MSSRFRPPIARVESIHFKLNGDEEILKRGFVVVTEKDSYHVKKPIDGGLADLHMGTTEEAFNCATCLNRKKDCPGHAGILQLRYPVKNPFAHFQGRIVRWLKIICFHCGRLITKSNLGGVRSKLIGLYSEHCKTITNCQWCGAHHPSVSRDPANYINIIIDSDKSARVITNVEIAHILSRITDETVVKVGKSISGHPRKYIIHNIIVPANTVRPDMKKTGGGKSNQNGLTKILRIIMTLNEKLPTVIPDMSAMEEKARNALIKNYNDLDRTVYDLIKGGPVGPGKNRTSDTAGVPLMSLADMLPKKTGQPRMYLMGKRVNFTARSVITEDGYLKPNEVVVPLYIAMEITIPETVQPWNREILTVYFNNRERYPGCTELIKASTGSSYNLNKIPLDYKLQDGDIIFRHMIDGDIIGFGRQPSLTYASIGGHKVRVLENSNTLSLNAVACPLYNADFDGDAMLAVVPRSEIAQNEARTLSAVGNWFISYQTQSPAMGLVQDGMIGTAVFSAANVVFNKWRAMDIMVHVNTDMHLRHVNFSDNKAKYTSRDLISAMLPRGINVVGKVPLMCRDAFVSYIKYHEQDTKVEIIDGKHISGVLDKASVGNENGSLFHVINNSYGVDHTFDCMHAFQRMATEFMFYHGFTVSIKDTNVSAEAQRTLKANIRQLIEQANLITGKLNRHEIYPPIGEELNDYYETLILNALQPGDLLINPIMADIDYYKNGIARLITVGSKGDMNNFSSINGGLCQQTIGGHRPPRQFGYQRTSPFFRRYEDDPVANGFIMQSFREGIAPYSLLFIAQAARNDLMAIALGTALGGEQNRNAAVTLSSIITDYRRGATKNNAIVQMLYSDSGVDPRKVENIKIVTAGMSTEAFNTWHINETDKRISPKYRTNETKIALDEEFKRLNEDREFYRNLSFKMEANSPGNSIMSDSKKLPFNVYKIMNDVKVTYGITNTTKIEDDPVEMINAVVQLCERLPLAYYNKGVERLTQEGKFVVPEYIIAATKLCCIAIRSHLAMKILLAEGIGLAHLNKIIETIWRDYKNSFMSYGMAVGVIASQCISEPLTQFILHAKHRTGVAGNKTSPLVRFKEILGAKPTKRMKNVSMSIMVPKEYRKDKSWVLNKCNFIEVMKFERFIITASIFFESYGQPIHPKYAHEVKMIKEFEARNAGLPKPADLSKWVIRFEIDIDELILRSITLDNIVSTLRKNTDIFVVHNRETEDHVVIRCYIRNSVFKTVNSSDARKWVEVVERLRNKLASMTIRGISGITRAYLHEIPFTEVQADGSTKLEKMYCINTAGVNMAEVLDLPYIDRYSVQTDSFLEMEETYGIAAARSMIISGLQSLHQKNIYAHCSIYADEMTFTGHITSIEKTGLGQREKTNVMLRMSFQYPNQTLEEAAMEGYTNEISGISAPLMIGRVPDLGSSYSKVVMNTEFITKNKKTLDEQLSEL